MPNQNALIDELLEIAGCKPLNESQEEWAWNYGSFEDYMDKYNIVYVLSEAQQVQSIWYPLIDAAQYKMALSEFVKNGELLRVPSKLVYNWADIVFRNSAIFNNIAPLYGANEDGYVPFMEVYEAFVGEYTEEAGQKFIQDLVSKNTVVDPKWAYYPIKVEDDWGAMIYILETNSVYEKLKMPDGHYDTWSDLQGFYDIGEFEDCSTVEEALVLINKYLDLYHQRSDLASLFITGGRESLMKISNG